jgi:integrase
MASIRKRGENSYLLVVSRGYDYQGNRLKPAQKTVHPPQDLTAKQTQKWLNEQAMLYEQEVRHTPGHPVDSSITLAKYIEIWLEKVAPKKLAASTLVRDRQDIRRILPALGHYKLTELNKEILRDFYDAMRRKKNENTGDPLAEKTAEGIHSCLCGILSDAVEAGYITHNPAWRAYKKKGVSKERPVADEKTVQRLIAALKNQSLKYEVYYKLILATGMRRGEACGLRWSDIDWRQRALHIRRNVVKLSRQPILVKKPKTRAGVRVVYLSKEMCKLLRAWEKECQWEKGQQGSEELT